MSPSPNLFDLAKAVFSGIWAYRLSQAKQQAQSIKKRVAELEKQTAGAIDRLVLASDDTLITAYEARVADPSHEEALLIEKQAQTNKPKRSFEKAFRTAIAFLVNPKKPME